MRGKSWPSAAVPAALAALALAPRALLAARAYALEDEYVQAFVALHPRSLAEFQRLAAQNPLHLVVDPLLTFLVSGLGSSFFWLRLPSLLLGTASVPLLWLAAGKDRRATIAALLLAASLFHVDWSARVDFYALLVFLTLAQTWAFLTGAWRRYALCAVIFACAHPYSWLVAGLHGLFAARRRALKPWASAWGLAVLAVIPWLFVSMRPLVSGASFSRGLGMISLARLALLFATTPSTDAGLSAPGLAGGLVAGVFAICWLVSLYRVKRAPEGGLLRLAHLLLLAGPVLVLALDRAFGYFFAPRQLLWLLPFYFVAVADGLLSFGSSALAVLVAGLALLSSARGFVGTYASYAELGSRQKELAEAVRGSETADDAFVFDSRELAYAFLFDYDRAAFRALPPFEFQGVALESRGSVELEVGRHKAAIVAPGDRSPFPREKTWRVRGAVGDVFVYPPERATPARRPDRPRPS